MDYTAAPVPGITPLVKCPEFDVRRVDFNAGYSLQLPPRHSFVVLMCLAGETVLTAENMEPVALRQGETALVPAMVTHVEMTGHAQLLTAMVP